MSCNYPVKEIVLSKIIGISVILRADSDKEALSRAIKLAEKGAFKEEFRKPDSVQYDSEIWNSYFEGVINEEVIFNGDVEENEFKLSYEEMLPKLFDGKVIQGDTFEDNTYIKSLNSKVYFFSEDGTQLNPFVLNEKYYKGNYKVLNLNE